jgi:hypothetical protein
MTTNGELRRLVKAWLDDALNRVSPSHMVHIHVDELANNVGRTPTERLNAITSAYVCTIDLLADKSRDVKAVLVIPLHDRARLECEPPGVDNLPAEMSDEPPSIYLIHREMDKRLRAGELYRCLLPEFHLFETRPSDVFVFFEAWRSEKERRDGWEYARTISAEHYVTQYQDRTL